MSNINYDLLNHLFPELSFNYTFKKSALNALLKLRIKMKCDLGTSRRNNARASTILDFELS